MCVCVLHVLGCSKQTRSFSKNTREGGYPSNQDTRERKQKKYEKQGGNMSVDTSVDTPKNLHLPKIHDINVIVGNYDINNVLERRYSS